ncbi:hypothetical protein [Bradyrhizobium altum]|uniref:hypothetical protein n=1 Tax=Bradyrhizobium altum TaxID=1571202 RepID=UPI001E45BD9F|nr:hypothetical protein [Bradyrhizobium altum]
MVCDQNCNCWPTRYRERRPALADRPIWPVSRPQLTALLSAITTVTLRPPGREAKGGIKGAIVGGVAGHWQAKASSVRLRVVLSVITRPTSRTRPFRTLLRIRRAGRQFRE